ncbi:hypothetical protein V2J09_008741 [Rumex salicifolius]
MSSGSWKMSSSLVQGFTKSLAMNMLSEIGDRTFCAAAILAMRNPRRTVFAGCLLSSIVMTTVSALLGWAAPNLISEKWTHHITTLLFIVFGFWSLWDGFNEADDGDELEEVEKELDDDDNLKKQNQPLLAKLFSPVFLKAFSITLFGEWGDKSQIATVGLAADMDAVSVILGGIVGQALCILAAVLGGKSLASKISEKMQPPLADYHNRQAVNVSFLHYVDCNVNRHSRFPAWSSFLNDRLFKNTSSTWASGCDSHNHATVICIHCSIKSKKAGKMLRKPYPGKCFKITAAN